MQILKIEKRFEEKLKKATGFEIRKMIPDGRLLF